jgi:hypothetical protein
VFCHILISICFTGPNLELCILCLV